MYLQIFLQIYRLMHLKRAFLNGTEQKPKYLYNMLIIRYIFRSISVPFQQILMLIYFNINMLYVSFCSIVWNKNVLFSGTYSLLVFNMLTAKWNGFGTPYSIEYQLVT